MSPAGLKRIKKATPFSFKGSSAHGRGSIKYRDRHCASCGVYCRILCQKLCGTCYRRMRYCSDKEYRLRENKRTAKYIYEKKKKGENKKKGGEHDGEKK